MRNDVCTLIGLIVQESEVTRVEKEIYCRRKSSTRSEFYSAYAVGLRPKFLFEIDPFDWEAVMEQLPEGDVPTILRYGTVEYNILLDYQTNESTMELTVG